MRMQWSVIALLACVGACHHAPAGYPVQGTQADAWVTGDRAEFRFTATESQLDPDVELTWRVEWQKRDDRDEAVPDQLFLRLEHAEAASRRPLRQGDLALGDMFVSRSARNAEPPAAMFLLTDGVRTTVRDGRLVFLVLGGDAVARILRERPDSVKLVSPGNRYREVAVRYEGTQDRQ